MCVYVLCVFPCIFFLQRIVLFERKRECLCENPTITCHIQVQDVSFLETERFLGAVGGAVGNAFASNTASQKENCVGCKFVWKKIHAGLDQSAGYDTVKNTFERVCMNMPDVFYDVVRTFSLSLYVTTTTTINHFLLINSVI